MKSQKFIASLIIALGAVFMLSGAVTYNLVHVKLVAEKITVSPDSPHFANQKIAGPWTAYAEASMISTHTLAATGGKTYAELDREDPIREVAMTGSFLRASLFTSVVSFGVAAFAGGVGLVFVLIGLFLLSLVRAKE